MGASATAASKSASAPPRRLPRADPRARDDGADARAPVAKRDEPEPAALARPRRRRRSGCRPRARPSSRQRAAYLREERRAVEVRRCARRDRARAPRIASRPLASTTTRAAIDCARPVLRARPRRRRRARLRRRRASPSHPSRSSAPHAPARRKRSSSNSSRGTWKAWSQRARERLGERVARSARRGPPAPSTKRAPRLTRKRVAHLVEDADGVEHPHARRQQRLAEVKARMTLALEHDDAAPERGEARRADRARRARRRSRRRRSRLRHSAVLGGGPSWMRSPMYAPMSVRRMPMPAKIR